MFNSQNLKFVTFSNAYSLKKESECSRKNGEGGNFCCCFAFLIFPSLKGD